MQGNVPGLAFGFTVYTPKPLPLVENMGVCYLLTPTSCNGLKRFGLDNVLGHAWPYLFRLCLTFAF